MRRRGFTLIELLVVMAVIALLLSVAVPRYLRSVDRAKESVLRQDLALMRTAVDQYYGDKGRYPDTLQDLVTHKYLRAIPPDPVTGVADTWQVEPPEDATQGGVYEIRSGATGTNREGVPWNAL